MAYRTHTLMTWYKLGLLASIGAAAGCGISVEARDVFSDTAASSSAGPGSGAGGDAATTGAGQGGASVTSTTTTTSTGAGGASVTSTGSGATEDCLDGIDNDGDNAIDCADTDCQAGFVCVDDPPSGWEGYYRVYEPPYPGPAVASCPDGSAPENYFTSPEGPAQCDACTCSALQNASCGPPGISCVAGSTSCTGVGADWTSSLLDGACHKPNLLGASNSLSCTLTGPGVLNAAGKCAPSAADFPNKNAWQGQLGACAIGPIGGGCDAGKSCLPKDPNDPSQSTCVRQDGTGVCPAGFGEIHQAYADATDTRGCDACACGAPGTTCGASQYTFYDLDGCALGGNDPPIVIDPNGCTNVSVLLDSSSWSAKATLPVPQGSCPASGGAPNGSLVPTGPVVFCCQ